MIGAAIGTAITLSIIDKHILKKFKKKKKHKDYNDIFNLK